MAFTVNMPEAAKRNLEAAETLAKSARRDVAGYLYGIAAECALKAMVAETALLRRDDIFYAHFPELRTLLRDAVKGRSMKRISAFVDNDSFLNNWNVRMRYAAAPQILDHWVSEWAQQARRAVNTIGT